MAEQDDFLTTVTKPQSRPLIVELSPTDRELLTEVARNTRRREAVTVISPVPGSDGSMRVDVVDPRRGVIPMPDTRLTTDEGDDRG